MCGIVMKETLVVVLLLWSVSGEIRVNLGSNRPDGTWIVWNQNKSIQVPARVPGGIYTDLRSGGVLKEDLFYRFNDMEYRWVSRDNWTYQTSFDLPQSMLKKSAINLVFHGVDTIGEVSLNGKFLISIDNMFVRYVLPIKTIVREKNNTLQVQLKSPVFEANRLAEIQKREYPIPPECTPSYYNGECHVNFLRKMQASFSWDWGPAFPSLGLWKPVEIEAFDLGVIRDLTAIPIWINSTTWQMNVTSFIEYADDYEQHPKILGRLTMADVSRNEIDLTSIPGETYKDPSVKNGYVSNIQFYVDEKSVEQWWPNGFGDQPLYDLTVTLETIDGTEISNKTIKIGFRTVELVQEKLQSNKEGLSFFFKVNGVPIFAKGSNWIPSHVLPELSYDESQIRRLLESAKEAHMNMLRVWGGGVYESDLFYSIADELGILIWQDMMFACSMYPTDEKFVQSVKTEVEQQVRRLQHHPSIVLWAGNNENEAALSGNWYGTKKNFTLYKEDYVKLYVDVIKPVVLANDKSREYITSSPTNGVKSVEEGYVAKNPYSDLYGDVHYYNYIFDGWNDYTYPDTRFASEYGFQSMPSYTSMSKVSKASDRTLNSEFTKKRQHLLAGNEFMMASIQRHLPLPKDDGSEEYYKTFIYYSQISQAMSTKTETEKYRRDRSKLTPDNKGNTMGAMYWQLNDVWQAPSWSSIEFGGRWKMLHYFAKKFLAPVLVSSERTPMGVLKVYLISDLLKDVPNVRLNVTVYSWGSFTPVKVQSSRVLLNKATSKSHGSHDVSELLSQANCDKYNCFIYLSVEGPNIFSDNVVYPARLNEVQNLEKPKLTIKIAQGGHPDEVALEVETDRIAPFVWLETDEEGEFSDNGFIMLKKKINLSFRNKSKKAINMEKFKASLTVRSVL